MIEILKNTRIFAGIYLLAIFFCSCSTNQTSQLLNKKPNDLPSTSLINDVPFFSQKAFHCGPSTLAMAMQFHGIDMSPSDLAKNVFTPELKGSFQVEMKAAARKQGMLAYVLTPKLVYLLAEVSVGHPVIVLQNLSIKLYPVWHYALVIGYDLNKKTVTLHTGTNENYQISMSTFERTWQRSGNWALVLLPSSIIPNDRNKLNILQAAVDLEQVGETEHANKAYQTILKRWPNEFVAIMGAGNTYLKLNQPTQASHWYFKASKAKPLKAEVYNNLAYSLLAQKCRVAALSSIKCALNIEPDNKNYLTSLQEISASNSSLSKTACPTVKCPK